MKPFPWNEPTTEQEMCYRHDCRTYTDKYCVRCDRPMCKGHSEGGLCWRCDNEISAQATPDQPEEAYEPDDFAMLGGVGVEPR